MLTCIHVLQKKFVLKQGATKEEIIYRKVKWEVYVL